MQILYSTLVAIAAYLLKNEILDPLRALRGARWKAATLLLVHENYLVSSPVPSTAAQSDMRHMAADLRAAYAQVPLCPIWARIGLAPSPEAVYTAAAAMIGLSNSSDITRNQGWVAQVRTELGVS